MEEKPKPNLLDPTLASSLETSSGFLLTPEDSTCLQVSLSLSDAIVLVKIREVSQERY